MPRKTEIGATRDSYVYRLRVPASLKTEWDDHCAKQGEKAPVMIRALMRYILQDDMPSKIRRVMKQSEGVIDSGPKERLEVRFTPSEVQGIKFRAEAEGCSPQRWVVNCVRASLTQEPQFTMETTKSLWESSYQLRAIGRNLNQIARRLNEGKNASLKIEQIEKLAAYIYKHTVKVANVLDASLSRWKIRVNKETIS